MIMACLLRMNASEADKELPDSDCTLQLDRAGKTLDLTASTSRACTVPFQTTQVRCQTGTSVKPRWLLTNWSYAARKQQLRCLVLPVLKLMYFTAATLPQSRLALLPGGRLNDVRLGTQRLDDDRSARGPGSYLPLTSIGRGGLKLVGSNHHCWEASFAFAFF